MPLTDIQKIAVAAFIAVFLLLCANVVRRVMKNQAKARSERQLNPGAKPPYRARRRRRRREEREGEYDPEFDDWDGDNGGDGGDGDD